MARTRIEWTESTWNPVTGCTKISPGCANCYARRLALRLRAMGQTNYRDGFKVALHEHMLERPLSWKKPQMIFVNSMSDLFHEGIPLDFIQRVFDIMRRAHWHRFQVLTKRSGRMAELAPVLEWSANVWIGVSIETSKFLYRADHLSAVPAGTRFLSLEPLLGPMPALDLKGMQWVIVGGESGPGARPMKEEWVLEIRDRCVSAGVPFFFKQWGGVNKKRAGRLVQGRTWDEMPQSLPKNDGSSQEKQPARTGCMVRPGTGGHAHVLDSFGGQRNDPDVVTVNSTTGNG
jgi:protein gp37